MSYQNTVLLTATEQRLRRHRHGICLIGGKDERMQSKSGGLSLEVPPREARELIKINGLPVAEREEEWQTQSSVQFHFYQVGKYDPGVALRH